jgi:hypothetical protein
MTLPTVPSLGNTNWRQYMVDMQAAQQYAAGCYVVASSESPPSLKAAAHVVCDGTNDEEEINDAIVKAAPLASRGGPGGAEQLGKVLLVGGAFQIDTDPILQRTGVWVQGMGPLTEIRPVSMTGVGGSGARSAVFKLFDANTHMTIVSDLWVNGNYSAGGACDAFFYDGGGSFSSYPDVNPDPDNTIRDCLITNFEGVANRYGIYLSDDMRGSQLSGLNMRRFTGDAIFATASPDSHLDRTHIGGCTGSGVNISGGNWKIANTKAYFCDSWGFNLANARLIATCIEAQDCANGIRLGGVHQVVQGWADTSDIVGVELAGNFNQFSGGVMCRASGRYPNTNTGVLLTGTPDDCIADIWVDPSAVTTFRSGNAGLRGRGMISGGTAGTYSW